MPSEGIESVSENEAKMIDWASPRGQYLGRISHTCIHIMATQ